jgi:hypothetical protein
MKTGEQYAESLANGRQAYIDGHQIKSLVEVSTTRAAVSIVDVQIEHK